MKIEVEIEFDFFVESRETFRSFRIINVHWFEIHWLLDFENQLVGFQ